ncbi:CoA-binding protein [Thermodesulfobacteriota bacterium]
MKRKDIHEILHPNSIAVVGASNDLARGATMFLNSLKEIGYEGKIYPIHPNIDVALGLKTYPSLLDVPGSVDHVIVGIPAHASPKVVEDAVKKGVRSIHFFTSGFAEVGTAEGVALQEKINEIAQGKVRIFGPNCMGIYNPKMKIAFEENQTAISGGAGCVSQSGGMATYFSRNAVQEGNYCSKVVSIGNSSDLRLTDFLEYLSEDDETTTISMYIEGLGDGEGKKLLEIIGNTTKRKPILIWKGGQTDQGAKTAFSHTGAMSSGYPLWEKIARQFGVTLVDSIEEMHDFIKLYRLLEPPKGTKCCMVTFGGGNSVVFADICARMGIELPDLKENIQKSLLEFIPAMGTILRNPVDISIGGWESQVIEKTLRTVGRDPNIDSIVLISQVGFIGGAADRFGMEPEKILDHQVNEIVSASRDLKIPLVCNNPLPFDDLAAEELRLYMKKRLEENQVPTFPTIERTMKALKRYHQYNLFLKRN